MGSITSAIPKSLLQLGGKTLLEWSIDRLHSAGCNNIIVAVGWKQDLVEKAIDRWDYSFPVKTIRVPDYERGALQTFTAAARMVHDSISILHPVDLVTSTEIVESVLSAHPMDNPFAITLLIDYSASSGSDVSIDSDDRIISIRGGSDGAPRKAKSAMLLAFSSGFPAYCEECLNKGDTTVVTALNSLILSQNSVFAHPVNEQWYDVDTINDALKANKYLLETCVTPDSNSVFVPLGDSMEVGDSVSLSSGISLGSSVILKGPCLISKNSLIAAHCTIGPNVSIGESTIIGASSVLHDVSIFGDSEIPTNSKINNALVYQSEIYPEVV